MQQELEKRVTRLTNEKTETIIQQTGIPPSLSVEDAKQYLYEILEEVKVRKV